MRICPSFGNRGSACKRIPCALLSLLDVIRHLVCPICLFSQLRVLIGQFLTGLLELTNVEGALCSGHMHQAALTDRVDGLAVRWSPAGWALHGIHRNRSNQLGHMAHCATIVVTWHEDAASRERVQRLLRLDAAGAILGFPLRALAVCAVARPAALRVWPVVRLPLRLVGCPAISQSFRLALDQ